MSFLFEKIGMLARQDSLETNWYVWMIILYLLRMAYNKTIEFLHFVLIFFLFLLLWQSFWSRFVDLVQVINLIGIHWNRVELLPGLARATHRGQYHVLVLRFSRKYICVVVHFGFLLCWRFYFEYFLQIWLLISNLRLLHL